ncbi:MAG: S-methyl-5'-thioadenosine phosphorylase [Candidatus Promineifilaceae bacterium]
MSNVELGIIGGSGLYQMDGMTDVEEIRVETPFGDPSDALTVGTIHGRRVAFVPRHGRGHTLTPGEVPYKANIYALKSLGVKYAVAVSACGSLREDYAPGHIVVPDQLYDNTKLRSSSFFGGGLVSHISVADPFSAELSNVVSNAARMAGGTVHDGGGFITIEGPRFSTRGESNVFRAWGMSIIGMTTSPEAYLAREAEIAYACMAHVTDYDVWHESEEPVTVEMVIRTLMGNTKLAQDALSHMIATMDEWAVEMDAHSGLKDSLITDRTKIPSDLRQSLDLLVKKYLD